MNATCDRNHLLADDGRCHVCEYAGPTAELQSRADRVGPNGDRPARPFSYRTLTEIVQNPIPAPPIQIEGLCREGELFILTGPADRLKSTTIAELAVCIASGRPVFDRFRVLRPGKALIIQNEIHPGVYDERMLRYSEPGADWLDKLLLISRQDFRIDEQSMAYLDNIIAQERLTFVGLDPLSEMYPDNPYFDENKSASVTEMLNRLKTVRDGGVTIGFAHHDPKDTERRARGSGRLIDSPDLRIFLGKANKKGMEIARARVEVKSRTLIPPGEFDIVLGTDGRLRYESASLTDEQEGTLEVLGRLGNATVAEVAQATDIERTAAYGRLTRLREKGKAIGEGSPQRWRLT